MATRQDNLHTIYTASALLWRSIKASRIEIPGAPELSAQQRELLCYIKVHGSLPVKEIAQRYGVSGSAATQIVDALESLSLVTRQPSQSDLRVTLVDLSESASKIVEAIQAQHEARLEQQLSHLSDDELSTLSSLLQKAASRP